MTEDSLLIRITIPDRKDQHQHKSMRFDLNETVWVAKQLILKSLHNEVKDGLNYGLYLPPQNARAGKFLDEERRLGEYPVANGAGHLEFKYKRRVYKLLNINTRKLKQIHTKGNLRQFFDYVKKGDVEKINSMTNKGLDSNFIETESGETPLTIAVSLIKKHVIKNIVISLFSGGAHLDFRNRDGYTAIHSAAVANNFEAVKVLLDLGASPNYKDRLGLTPLFLAVANNVDSRICENLLHDHSVLCLSDDQGWTETHNACKHGNEQTLEHLLYYGADMNVQNNSGNTPLHVAALNGQEGCVRMLLFRGAEKSIQNYANQDPRQVAVIADNFNIANIIQNFSLDEIVPIQEIPQYNKRRRSVWTAGTLTRSKSDPRINLAGRFSRPASPTQSVVSVPAGSSTISNIPVSPNTIFSDPNSSLRSSISNDISSDSIVVKKDAFYALLERGSSVGARTVVLQKGRNGFGFVLRGTKAQGLQSINFVPTPQIPALQFLDRVDSGSAAYKAGLKSGDYILDINGHNVASSSHEEAVRFIKQSGDTLTLKIMTVADINLNGNQKEMNILRPPPPARHPATSLSAGSKMFKDFSNVENGSLKVPASIRSRATPRRLTANEIHNMIQEKSAKKSLSSTETITESAVIEEITPDYEPTPDYEESEPISPKLNSSNIIPPAPPLNLPGPGKKNSNISPPPAPPPPPPPHLTTPKENGISTQLNTPVQKKESKEKVHARKDNKHGSDPLLLAIQLRRNHLESNTSDKKDIEDVIKGFKSGKKINNSLTLSSFRNEDDKLSFDNLHESVVPPPPEFGDAIDSSIIDPPALFNRNNKAKQLNIIDWAVSDVLDWLDEIDMGRYKTSFENRHIDGRALMQLGRTELFQMGITQVGERLNLEKAIKKQLVEC